MIHDQGEPIDRDQLVTVFSGTVEQVRNLALEFGAMGIDAIADFPEQGEATLQVHRDAQTRASHQIAQLVSTLAAEYEDEGDPHYRMVEELGDRIRSWLVLGLLLVPAYLSHARAMDPRPARHGHTLLAIAGHLFLLFFIILWMWVYVLPLLGR